jgi:hypothetical protein
MGGIHDGVWQRGDGDFSFCNIAEGPLIYLRFPERNLAGSVIRACASHNVRCQVGTGTPPDYLMYRSRDPKCTACPMYGTCDTSGRMAPPDERFRCSAKDILMGEEAFVLEKTLMRY